MKALFYVLNSGDAYINFNAKHLTARHIMLILIFILVIIAILQTSPKRLFAFPPAIRGLHYDFPKTFCLR